MQLSLCSLSMGGLLKNMLSQLIYRPGAQSYKDDLLKKFLPRALAGTSLGGTQIEEAVRQQLGHRKYQSALQTLNSHEASLNPEHFLPDRFKQSFNEQSNSPQLVQATRSIFNMLTTTLDQLTSSRLTTTTNLLTSLITSLIEGLRLEIEAFDKKNSRELKEILKLLKETNLGVKGCTPPDQGGLYSCFAAILILVCLIFPGLFALRNSVTNFIRKIQSTQTASNLRKAQRLEYCRGRSPDRFRDHSPTSRANEDHLNQIQWPDSTLPAKTKTFLRRGSFRGEINPQGRRQAEFQEDFQVQSMVGACAGPEDFTTTHRKRPTLMPEATHKRTLAQVFTQE